MSDHVPDNRVRQRAWSGEPGVITQTTRVHVAAPRSLFPASAIGHGVRVERLLPYAPDLNPVEGAWQHLKHVEMHNLVCLDLEELHLELYLAVGRLRKSHG